VTLSTHLLDVEHGRPLAGVPVLVEQLLDQGWVPVAHARTGTDGRAGGLVPADSWRPGTWRLTVDTTAAHGPEAFYPQVTVVVAIGADPAAPDGAPAHHHLPLLLSRHGYTTYRGS